MMDIVLEGNSLHTNGLQELLGNEIRVSINDSDLTESASRFLRWTESTIRANPGLATPYAKLEYGYWEVYLREGAGGYLDAWEYDAGHSSLNPGITQALKYWEQQDAVCREHHAPFIPPSSGLLAGVSAGVLEGMTPIYAIRHLAPSHMSGWYFWTDLYQGEHRKMVPEHLFHVTAAQPKLAKYLALPVGFCLTIGDTECVDYDKEMAEEPIP